MPTESDLEIKLTILLIGTLEVALGLVKVKARRLLRYMESCAAKAWLNDRQVQQAAKLDS